MSLAAKRLYIERAKPLAPRNRNSNISARRCISLGELMNKRGALSIRA
jgi:hypothetical protein